MDHQWIIGATQLTLNQLASGQTAALLGMQTEDAIDVHLKEACTRGAHPLPVSQTSPNMHHLDTSERIALEEDTEPPTRKATVSLTFRNDSGLSMKFRLGVDQPISRTCEMFEVRLGMAVGHCRFHAEGQRLERMKTPKELELEDEYIVECYSEMIGGSPSGEVAENFSHRLEPRLGPVVYVEQVTLIFADGYRHRFPVVVASDSRLQQALRYAAHRMGKNPDHVSFEIEGRRIDFRGLGTTSPADLAIENETVVEVRYAPSKPDLTRDPDDLLLPRSIRLCVRPLDTQTEARSF